MSTTRTAGTPRQLFAFSALSASLTAGYGVLFTLVGDYRDTYGISETSIGWIIGTGFVAGFVAQVFFAPLGDIGYAKTVIRVGVMVNVIGLLIMAIGDTTLLLGTGRLISGLAAGAVQPVIQRTVVLLWPDDVGQTLGRILSASVFGFAVGPAISAVLVGPFGLAAPFYVVAAIGVASMALTVGTDTSEGVASEATAKQARLAFDLLESKPLIGALCYGAATYVMIGGFDVLWDVVHADLNTVPWLANLGISIFAMPLIVLGPLGGRLAERFGPFRLGGLGLIIAAAFMAIYGVLPTGTSIVAVGIVHAFSDGLTIAATGVAVAITAPPERQAGAQGLLGAAQALAAGMVAPLVGWLYQTQGRVAAYSAVAAIMGVLVSAGLFLARDVVRRAGRPVAAS